MKDLLYKFLSQAALTAVALLMVFSPYTSLIAQAQTAPAANSGAVSTNNIFAACMPSSFSFTDCITSLFYAFTVGVGSTFAYVATYFFDVTVQLSLNGSAYGLDFISTSWTTARDLANMAFLFILLYIAFNIIFKAETNGTMSLLAGVIMVALLVNFSFFFTRVVIDAGNILALQFYNSIPAPSLATSVQGSAVTNLPGGSSVNSAISSLGGANTKDLTAGIMNMLQVQNLLNKNSFESTNGSGANGSTIATLFLFITIAIVLWILTVAFITNGIKFLYRVVVLWFLIVASPLAFAAAAIQGFGGGYFKQWRTLLFNHAFYPVAFLFIFLILNNFAVTIGGTTGLVGGVFATLPSGGASTWPQIGAALVSIFIRLSFVIIILFVAMKASDNISVAGEKTATKIGGWFGDRFKSVMLAPARLSARSAGGIYAGGVGSAAYDTAQQLKGTRFGNSRVGTFLRKGVLEPVAGTKFGGAKSYTDVIKARKEVKTETGNNARDIENKEKIKAAPKNEEEYNALEKRDKAYKEFSVLDAKEKAFTAGTGPALTPVETTKLADHKARKTTDLNPAEKAKKDELNTKLEDAKSRIRNLNKREVDAMSSDDIKSVAHLMNESQIKAIKDSSERSDKDKEAIASAWQEKSAAAPLQKAHDAVYKLAAIDASLKKAGVHTAPITIPELDVLNANSLTATGSTVESSKVEAAQTAVDNEMINTRAALDSLVRGAATQAQRVELNQRIATLQSAKDKLKELNDARKDVPANVGGKTEAGKFTVKAK